MTLIQRWSAGATTLVFVSPINRGRGTLDPVARTNELKSRQHECSGDLPTKVQQTSVRLVESETAALSQRSLPGSVPLHMQASLVSNAKHMLHTLTSVPPPYLPNGEFDPPEKTTTSIPALKSSTIHVYIKLKIKHLYFVT